MKTRQRQQQDEPPSSCRRASNDPAKSAETPEKRETRSSTVTLSPTAISHTHQQRTSPLKRESNAGTNGDSPAKRARPTAACGVQGCNGTGCIDGELPTHSTRVGCPTYHNLTAAQCSQLRTARSTKDRNMGSVGLRTASQQTKTQKEQLDSLLSERKQVTDSIRERLSPYCSKRHADARDKEPVLEHLSTQTDLELFRHAQAALGRAAEDRKIPAEEEQGERIMAVQFGRFDMTTWYPSPYPAPINKLKKLFVCEFCLKYVTTVARLRSHMVKCPWFHPAGDEIYRKGTLSVFEVDGKRSTLYCRNLCLLAKLFLDHKTLYHDVEPFLFYVMTESDSAGCHLVGYFSKEKKSFMNCNVSCIMVLPPYQRKGYGRLLIEFSYLLSRKEQRLGSPERPLSDLGLISYRNYWTDVILTCLSTIDVEEDKCISIKDLGMPVWIHPNDIVSTLQFLGMIKYFKGDYWVYKNEDALSKFLSKKRKRGSSKAISPNLILDETCLNWEPHPETV